MSHTYLEWTRLGQLLSKKFNNLQTSWLWRRKKLDGLLLLSQRNQVACDVLDDDIAIQMINWTANYTLEQHQRK